MPQLPKDAPPSLEYFIFWGGIALVFLLLHGRFEKDEESLKADQGEKAKTGLEALNQFLEQIRPKRGRSHYFPIDEDNLGKLHSLVRAATGPQSTRKNVERWSFLAKAVAAFQVLASIFGGAIWWLVTDLREPNLWLGLGAIPTLAFGAFFILELLGMSLWKLKRS